jgi:Cu(I)/Ag(I) efflux system protein CusF
MKQLLGIAILLAGLAASAASGSTHDAAALFEGEVRRVDKDARKITLRHGPMPSLDMPAHTMVFQVKDPAMLDQVKPGDKVRFHAEKRGGAFTITEMRPAED